MKMSQKHAFSIFLYLRTPPGLHFKVFSITEIWRRRPSPVFWASFRTRIPLIDLRYCSPHATATWIAPYLVHVWHTLTMCFIPTHAIWPERKEADTFTNLTVLGKTLISFLQSAIITFLLFHIAPNSPIPPFLHLKNTERNIINAGEMGT